MGETVNKDPLSVSAFRSVERGIESERSEEGKLHPEMSTTGVGRGNLRSRKVRWTQQGGGAPKRGGKE